MTLEALIERYRQQEDTHIARVMGCWVVVSGGEVVEVERTSALQYCPLHRLLGEFDVETYIRSKIKNFGHYTNDRSICCNHAQGVPFGTSEILQRALENKTVDCAVTACDGAGTVITDNHELVQGIGARMSGLFYTSAIPETIKRIRKEGGYVFEDSRIYQTRGVLDACEMGYKKIAVTVNAFHGDNFYTIRKLEKEIGVEIFILAVCSTGVSLQKAEEVVGCSDLVWSCASGSIRQKCSGAKLQISKAIPVFVMTSKGLELTKAYTDDTGRDVLNNLDTRKQYLAALQPGGIELNLGKSRISITESELPVSSNYAPSPLL